MNARNEGPSPVISRRGFLAAAGGAALAVALPVGARAARAATGPKAAETTVTPDKLGAAVWACEGQWVADAPATLATIAAIGYRYVELPTTFPYGSVATRGDARAVRKACADNGLWCLATHHVAPYPYDDTAWRSYVEDNLVLGSAYLGSNYFLPATAEECARYVDAVHTAHDVARQMGFEGPLFNHMEKASWVKLSDEPDRYSVELILEQTTPDVFQLELDAAHALWPLGTVANVVAMVRKHPGRFPLLHLKDGFAPVGPTGGAPLLFNPTPFGAGDFGRPDPTDPVNRPHAGFQDLLAAVRDTTDWSEVRIMAEQDASACLDYLVPFYEGMNGLRVP